MRFLTMLNFIKQIKGPLKLVSRTALSYCSAKLSAIPLSNKAMAPSNNCQRLAEFSQILSFGAIAVNEENHTNDAIQAPAINHSGAAC